jgi:HEAT repeat protein
MILGNLGPLAMPAHADLLASLADDQQSVRRQAASALRRVPAESRAGRLGLAGALRHPDDFIRREAAYALAEQAAACADIAPELGELAASADPDLRHAALRILMKLDPAAALPVLMLRLEAGETATRSGAAHAIGAFGPRAGVAVPALTRLLRQPELQAAALQALEALGIAARPAVPDLVELLRTSAPSSEASLGAARTLGSIGAEARAALPHLRAILADAPLNEATGRARKAAAQALQRILAPGDPDLSGYARRLARSLGSLEAFTRAEAARSLVDLGSAAAPAMDALRRRLRQDDIPKIRYLAAEALGGMGASAKPAIEDLRRACGDPDPSVRRKAAEALAILVGLADCDFPRPAAPDQPAS